MKKLAIHPKRAHIHSPNVADTITLFLGSWYCVGLHALWFLVWFVLKLDINLLTLVVSLEAIFLAAFVMMSQSRSAQKDRARDDLEASEVDTMASIVKQIHELTQEVHKINLQQNDKLETLRPKVRGK